MSKLRFTKSNGKQTSIETSHVIRLEESTANDTTLLIMTDGSVEVRGSMQEVEDRLEGRATAANETLERAPSGKTILMEDASRTPVEREYKRPQDPSRMFADENYDQVVGTS